MNVADCHILVIDDHALQRSLLVRMLASLSVNTVLEAANGEDALAMIAADPPRFDLVITDLDMPGTDGMELARGIAALPSPPPVALVSAPGSQILASVGTLSRSSSRALLSILPKPVSIERMLADKVARAAVESSLQLAQRLSLRSCGEGIESGEIVRQLRWLGCELGQGYLFTKPLPPERVLPWLSDWATRRGELIEEWRQH